MNCKTDLRFEPACPSYDFSLKGKQLFVQILLEIILLYETVLFWNLRNNQAYTFSDLTQYKLYIIILLSLFFLKLHNAAHLNQSIPCF